MRTADFDFALPADLIAQAPTPHREESRLLVLHRATGEIEHRTFRDLGEHLGIGDALVLNDSKVIPARLRAVNQSRGGQFEILLLEENKRNDWWALLRPAKRARIGTRMVLADGGHQHPEVEAQVLDLNAEGQRRLQFSGVNDIRGVLPTVGEIPLPPYIARAHGPLAMDRERYQTVFARHEGSVAAPTAGLHFTEELLERLRAREVRVCFVTLHVGLATFAPVKAEMIEEHNMHEERYELSAETARVISEAQRAGRRVIAAGTTTARVLETVAALHLGSIVPHTGRTRIFIRPPFRFQVADALLTNFHLPRSTLLMLVSAFAAPDSVTGRELILSAYAEAVRERYRFFSYGDAMLIL